MSSTFDLLHVHDKHLEKIDEKLESIENCLPSLYAKNAINEMVGNYNKIQEQINDINQRLKFMCTSLPDERPAEALRRIENLEQNEKNSELIKRIEFLESTLAQLTENSAAQSHQIGALHLNFQQLLKVGKSLREVEPNLIKCVEIKPGEVWIDRCGYHNLVLPTCENNLFG